MKEKLAIALVSPRGLLLRVALFLADRSST